MPIYREINADLETPVSAYLKVARPPYSFLLESVEGGEHLARYSFIGTEPDHVIETGPGRKDGEVDPLGILENILSDYKVVKSGYLPRFMGGAVGYLSYEVVRYFENIPNQNNDVLDVQESVFMMTKTFLVFDHVRHVIQVVSHVKLDEAIEDEYSKAVSRIDEIIDRLNSPLDPSGIPDASGFESRARTSNMTPEYHQSMVENSQGYVVDGDVIQVVVSQRFSRPSSAHPFHIYRSLRAINPSPYMYYLNMRDFQIVGASPEMLVQVEDGMVSTHPIAGTRPRSDNLTEDMRLEKELQSD